MRLQTLLPTVLLSFCLSSALASQSIVKPIRIALTIPTDTETNTKLGAEVRARLSALRYVRFVSQRADYEVFIAATAHCGEFAVALHVFEKRGPGRLDIYSGPDLPAVADHLVKELDGRFFRPRAQGDDRR